MSVQSEITRISGNVSAALAAIADKGVDVPDGSTSDALAGLIAAIEAGGGGGAKFLTGEFTLDTPVAGVSVEHNFGEVPNFAFYFAKTAPRVTLQYESYLTKVFSIYFDGWFYSYYVQGGMSNKNTYYGYGKYDITGKPSATGDAGKYGTACSATDKTINIGNDPSFTTGYFKSGITYAWGVGVL